MLESDTVNSTASVQRITPEFTALLKSNKKNKKGKQAVECPGIGVPSSGFSKYYKNIL